MSKKTIKQPSPFQLRQKRIYFYFVITVIFLGLVSFVFSGEYNSQIETSQRQATNPNRLFLGPGNKSHLESPDLILIQKNSLKASLPPTTFPTQVLGALVGTEDTPDTRRGIVEYVVESGDNLWSIANNFDISLESLLWANDLNENSIIRAGQKLIIPPVSGVIYHVKTGDTISGIAKTYKGKVEEMIAFNDLSPEGEIFVGDILVIPGGEMPPPVTYSAPQYVPLASSYFICPIATPCSITQGLHWYNAIDFSHGNCGEPVYAVAGGQVLRVRITSSTSKWAFGGAGNHLTILHPNGVVTLYGHIAKSLVVPGQQVSQGEIIALVGGQPGTPGAGMSTGCHLHFGVRGAINPFAR